MLKRGTPVIINDYDRPEAKLVAVLMGYDAKKAVWKARYLAPEAGMIYCWSTHEPTALADFGMNVEIANNLYRVVPNGKASSAKYRDGKDRRWQGDAPSIWMHFRKPARNLLSVKG